MRDHRVLNPVGVRRAGPAVRLQVIDAQLSGGYAGSPNYEPVPFPIQPKTRLRRDGANPNQYEHGQNKEHSARPTRAKCPGLK